ncbi:3-hydroxyisobutyrate dehydrogenase [Dictyostelium discoideum AX4]|uniref:Probable 3-hydroxyisobutyrate dehydrogenase, mitochondrial n=1 Tax=Dictyostelium discoideum TaxID=44689 RepID=3HIDH_DICDI|nr:3-hydroxyisobutyrate dehydrogenase [Dictyostelium discoideum AX4]Q54CX6.1 RecName: Full=Probable 3-hydroxyisobutyrate dehydrogenase, mitochondrial; Short=HIBADH; Flags: Precursor [Dictyostelium discoideum]EAL61086.1 3-hydroxyisobutyrate dehydrogenase [Dictyostelium discoideum AX4]|eukprot:XP_629544.1 3-hydroxyisobutyrate dehydrogenase [Dictyostelium discoideum AX4]
MFSSKKSLLLFKNVRYMSTSSSKTVGFIGLGNMGGHQAINLIKKGHNLIVFDMSKDNMNRLKEKGAKIANSPAEVAKEADVIVTMLPASAHVKNVYCGENGIFQTVRPGTLLLDSSTIDPATAREVASIAKKHQSTMLDCPVSGGTGGAEAGTLTFMVGGSEQDFNTAKTYLECMGKNIVHCGDVGTGQVAKVCNNLVLGISMIAVSEAMNLGVKQGMDPKKLAGIFNTSSARCWTSELYNPCPGVIETSPASRGYTGGFGSALMTKDLGLAVDSAKSIGEPLLLGNSAHQLYTLLVAKGDGQKDFSVVYDFLNKNFKNSN